MLPFSYCGEDGLLIFTLLLSSNGLVWFQRWWARLWGRLVPVPLASRLPAMKTVSWTHRRHWQMTTHWTSPNAETSSLTTTVQVERFLTRSPIPMWTARPRPAVRRLSRSRLRRPSSSAHRQMMSVVWGRGRLMVGGLRFSWVEEPYGLYNRPMTTVLRLWCCLHLLLY